MKKIVALGAAAALIGGLFAAEPASNPSLVSFTGNASVEWGVDLDAGKTGFKNGTWTEFKIKLFDAGDKATSGDGVWAELVMKVDDQDSCGPNGWQDGSWKSGNNAYIDVAKLHFNNIYVGIKSGDTQVGELDFTTAIRSADPWYHPGRWLTAVGPENFTQGIVAGYEDDNMNIGVDFRSLDKGQYTNAYAVAGEFKIKDSNSFAEGLSVGLGAAYNLSDTFYAGSAKVAAAVAAKPASSTTTTETHAIAVEGDTVTETVEVSTTTETAASEAKPIAAAYNGSNGRVVKTSKQGHLLGYSASVGYKFKIDDKYWFKPQAGLTGELFTSNYDDVKVTGNANTVAAGVIFAWGETNSYGNTGTLYYFDDDWGDKAKGLTPGLSAMVYIPLASTGTTVTSTATTKGIAHDALKAMIVPSVYSGDLVENLKFAAYSEIGLFNYRENGDPDPVVAGTTTTYETFDNTVDGKNTFALALAAGVRYDIKADDITVTPKASVRYANTCYVANKERIDGAIPASGQASMFPVKDLGIQDTVSDSASERFGLLAGDFFNLEAGVEVAGLINNTTFYGHYKSANLLNKTNYSSETIDNVANPNYAKYGMYNVKLGTFNVGCKIAF